MHFHIPFLLALAVQSIPAATAEPSYPRALAKRFHNAALKHSAGLARDLRTAFGGILDTREPRKRNSKSLQKRNVYCVSQNNGQVPFGHGHGHGNGTSSSSSSSTQVSRPTSTSAASSTSRGSPSSTSSSASASATPSSTSSWSLVEAHVSFCLPTAQNV